MEIKFTTNSVIKPVEDIKDFEEQTNQVVKYLSDYITIR